MVSCGNGLSPPPAMIDWVRFVTKNEGDMLLNGRTCTRRAFIAGAAAATIAGFGSLAPAGRTGAALADEQATPAGAALPSGEVGAQNTSATSAPVTSVPTAPPSWVDAQVAEALLAQADDPDVASILCDAQALGELDQDLAEKLLELAADDPAARSFVAGFRASYPGTKAGGLTADDLPDDGSIPHLMQWNKRWGYMEYIGGPLGTKGCCPTSLAMLYAGLSGRTDMSPYMVSLLATESELCDAQAGTHGEFVGYFCERVGLEWTDVTTIDEAASYLNGGWLLVCNLGAGEFTDLGHYVLITGWSGYDGDVHVNDPYTTSVNERPWPLVTIFYECNSTYAVRAGEALLSSPNVA